MMKPLTIAAPHSREPAFEKALLSLTKSDLVERIVIVSQEPVQLKIPKGHVLVAGPLSLQETLSLILGEVGTKFLLLLPGSQAISIGPQALARLLERAASAEAGLI